MAHALVDVHQMRNALLGRERAEFAVIVGLLLRRAGRVVVKEQDRAVRLGDARRSHLVERFHRLIVQIVDARPVDGAADDLARVDGRNAGLGGQQLLDRVHEMIPPSRIFLDDLIVILFRD